MGLHLPGPCIEEAARHTDPAPITPGPQHSTWARVSLHQQIVTLHLSTRPGNRRHSPERVIEDAEPPGTALGKRKSMG